MAKRGYFFDLDGTLVNTHESNASAYMQAVQEVIGEDAISRDELLHEISAGRHCGDFLKELIPDITDKQIRDVARRKAEVYPNCLDASTLNQELVGSMREWRQDSDVVIALVTTAKAQNAMNVIKYHGIDDLFDIKVFGDEIERLKPDPEIYLRALAESDLSPEDVEAFEDSKVGIESASRAGIHVNVITWATDV